MEALDIRPDNFVLIATNNQDREALDKLIEQPIAWLGLLASRRKVQLFLRQLREKGVAEEHIARLHAPVGYNIGAETPQEIAISVLAEILQVKNTRRVADDETFSSFRTPAGGDSRCGRYRQWCGATSVSCGFLK